MAEDFAGRVGKIVGTRDVKQLKALLKEARAVERLNELPGLMAYAFSNESDDDVASFDDCKLFAEMLVAAGIELNLSDTLRFSTPIASVVWSSLWNDVDKAALVKQMLARGADPNVITERANAIDLARPPILELLLPKATADSLLRLLMSALNDDIESRNQVQLDSRIAELKGCLGRVKNVDRTVVYEERQGRGPIHVAAIGADRQAIELLLRKAKDPGLQISAPGSLSIDHVALSGGECPTFSYKPGMTAVDLIDGHLEILEKAHAKHKNRKGDDAEARARCIARLKDNRAALVAAGVKPGKVRPAGRKAGKIVKASKPYKAVIDQAFRQLAKSAGVDVDVTTALEDIDTAEHGPWGYFKAAIDELPELANKKLSKKLARSPLLRFLAKDPYDGGPRPELDYSGDDDDSSPLDVDDYPKAARLGLKHGVVVGASGADIFFLWPTKKGSTVARVCHAHRKGFEILGDSVEDFVQKEVAKLKG